MELVGVLLMIVAGGATALFVALAAAIARREAEQSGRTQASVAADRDKLAASILYNLLTLGGSLPADAMRVVRARARIAAPVTSAIDISSWAGRFADRATPEQRAWLLETAVASIVDTRSLLPLRQYSALLDLSFALGFHTDALFRLRDQYGFDYIDHAKNGRPREADRRAGAATLFSREVSPDERRELLSVLEIREEATRQTIVSAYRRLAAQHHPDRFFDAGPEEQEAAAARFIELTRAYERLLAVHNGRD
jgi:DnaJ domain